MAISLTKFLRNLCKRLRPWISELIIRGIIPDRIGKYRILDMLLTLEENNEPSQFL